jgi:predicted XRE-type DNA-binding protein
MSVKITRSSGNVFRDLGFSQPEAAHLLIRSELMTRLRKVIEARGLKQAEAARMFRVSQPRVSALMKGRIDLFSVDTLIDMLDRAGFTVKFALTKSTPRKVA